MRSSNRMNIQTFSAVAAVLMALVVPRPAQAQLPAEFRPLWNELAAEHRRNMEAAGIVGGSIAFVHDGEIIAADYFGFADRETGRPVDENTIYHWASITKTFTGLGVMQLRERNLIGLHDPIVEYVPELRGVRNRFGSMEGITLFHLLTHSSGFRGPTWPWGGDEPWHPHEPTEWSQLVSMIPYTQIEFEPGSRNGYSNPGSIFLGRVIEHTTGDVYEAYIDKNIFRLLDMRRSYFDTEPWHLEQYRSNSYEYRQGQAVAHGIGFNTGITVSNGGLNAPVSDMAKYAAFLMNEPAERRPLYDQVARRETLEEMWQPARGFGTPQNHIMGAPGQGLHIFIYDADGHRIVGHTGGQKSFSTFLYVAPDAGVAIIGAYNTAGGDETAPATGAVRNAALQRVRTQLFPLFWADRPPHAEARSR